MNSKIVSKTNAFSNIKTFFSNLIKNSKMTINNLVNTIDIPDDEYSKDFSQYTTDVTTIEELEKSYTVIENFEKALTRENIKTENKSLGTTLKAEPNTMCSSKSKGNIQTISTLDGQDRDF